MFHVLSIWYRLCSVFSHFYLYQLLEISKNDCQCLKAGCIKIIIKHL